MHILLFIQPGRVKAGISAQEEIGYGIKTLKEDFYPQSMFVVLIGGASN